MNWPSKLSDMPQPNSHAQLNGAGGASRVLFVDDDPLVRAMAGAILQALGWEVIHACSGEEAASLLQSCGDRQVPVDVVIMDIVMPGGMSGVDALQHLRQIDPRVRVIASSGFFDRGGEEICSELGFSGVLAKPYSPEQLSEKLGHFKHSPALAS